jgi:hypothetical protein
MPGKSQMQIDTEAKFEHSKNGLLKKRSLVLAKRKEFQQLQKELFTLEDGLQGERVRLNTLGDVLGIKMAADSAIQEEAEKEGLGDQPEELPPEPPRKPPAAPPTEPPAQGPNNPEGDISGLPGDPTTQGKSAPKSEKPGPEPGPTPPPEN